MRTQICEQFLNTRVVSGLDFFLRVCLSLSFMCFLC